MIIESKYKNGQIVHYGVNLVKILSKQYDSNTDTWTYYVHNRREDSKHYVMESELEN